jgi:diguanylate cyclase (GGDEF)-like protein
MGTLAKTTGSFRWFDAARPLRELIDEFKAAAPVGRRLDDLDEQNGAAVLIFESEGGRPTGPLLNVVSGAQLARQLARPHYRNLYNKRPMREVLTHWPFEPTVVSGLATVADVVQAGLARPGPRRYEPVVVWCGGDPEDARLVDVAQVFRAQNDSQDAAVRRLRQAEASLRIAADHDALTRLPNRRQLLRRLGDALAKGRQRRRPVGLLYLDFDRFKWVNDSLGHTAGDELLVSIADRLAKGLRQSDTVAHVGREATADAWAARVGGDEFIVLLDGLAVDSDAELVAHRLLGALATPHNVQGQPIVSTASIGLATSAEWLDAEANLTEQAEALIQNADLAMYRAKMQGGARVVRFDEGMRQETQFRVKLESLLPGAAERDELQMHFQPLIDLQDEQFGTVSYEALIRWHCPQLAPPNVRPDQFIPLAEETGEIRPIGRWVLDRTFRDFDAFAKASPGLSVSVNLSPCQFDDARTAGDLLNHIEQLLASRRHAWTLRCEVTETSMIRNRANACDFLERLRKLGVAVLLDDFGTGYSSLAQLAELPLDGVKLDRRFLAKLQNTPRQIGLVRAMVTLTRELDMQLVAEGVETVEQRDLLRELGCPTAQGYLFGKPAALAELDVPAPRRAAA